MRDFRGEVKVGQSGHGARKRGRRHAPEGLRVQDLMTSCCGGGAASGGGPAGDGTEGGGRGGGGGRKALPEGVGTHGRELGGELGVAAAGGPAASLVTNENGDAAGKGERQRSTGAQAAMAPAAGGEARPRGEADAEDPDKTASTSPRVPVGHLLYS